MTYCFELNMATIIFWTFVLGIATGIFCYRIIATPRKPAKPIDYDGTNGKGYQPRPPVPLPEKPKK